MFCPKCGTDVGNGKFCSECGAAIVDENNVVKESEIKTNKKSGGGFMKSFRLAMLIICVATWCYICPELKELGAKVVAERKAHDAININIEGNYYRNGAYGFPRDYFNAMKCYKKAAEAGCAEAIGNLGYCYFYGFGCTQDYAQAFEFYKKAVEAGDNSSLNYLGMCYEEGYGCIKDYSEAFECYKKAMATEDNDTAMNNLGLCYIEGKGCIKDRSKGLNLLKQAADKGNDTAMTNLGICYQNDGNESEAFYWYKKAAEADNAKGMHKLGECYRSGIGCVADYGKAEKWFEKAADAGYNKDE